MITNNIQNKKKVKQKKLTLIHLAHVQPIQSFNSTFYERNIILTLF